MRQTDPTLRTDQRSILRISTFGAMLISAGTARMKTQNSDAAENRDERSSDLVLSEIQDALRGLKYGHVTIVVQDGVVVQIERVERRRLARRGSTGADSCP